MKIAAFNVKQLGWKKVNNPFVRENLIKIVSRYSVVVMLEVIDATGKAMDKFLGALNDHEDNVQHPYEMKCSEPLGRGSYREKFVFFYRKDQVKMINSYQYEEEEEEEEEDEEEEDEDYEHGEEYEDEEEDDEYENKEDDDGEYEDEEDDDEYEDEENDDGEYEDEEDDDDEEEEVEEDYEEDDNYEDDTEDEAVDVLAREPFILQFKSPTTVVKRLALIPVHTKPEDAERELDAVDDVVKAVRKRWRTTNIMILGDFNADGRYLSKRKKKKIRISSSPYHWLIKDDVDTTTSNCNDHTYDRIVVYRKTMLDAVVPGSAKPFNFQKEFNLTDEQTLSISDHYPVEVELRTKAPAQGLMALPRTTKTTSIKRKTQKKGAQKKRRAKPAGAEKITKAELTGAEKKKTTPAALQKKKKSESAGAQKKTKAKPAGAEKRKKIEVAGAEKKKKEKVKAKPAGAEKKKTEAAGAEKKKKAEAAALQKTKNMTGKRTRGPSSDTPAKRRRLEKCQSETFNILPHSVILK